MHKTYAYIRVSTREQNEERQIIAMREFGIADTDMIIDKQSGKDFNRPGYKRLMKKLKPEDKCEVIFENKYDYPSVPIIPPPVPQETKPAETKPVETEPPETEPEETEPEETEPEETEPEETEPETEPETETETELPEPEEILVQTGQLNWPISVLSIGGMGFVAVGCVFLSGKHREAEEKEEDGE